MPGLLMVGQEQYGFSKVRGTFLGEFIIRIMVYWGLYWGRLSIEAQ